MKQRNSASQKSTKNEFKNLEKSISQLDKKVGYVERSLRFEIISSAADTKQRLEEKISKLINKLFTRMDPLLKEIEDVREDRTITTHQISELQDSIENHEGRIKKLELTSQIT